MRRYGIVMTAVALMVMAAGAVCSAAAAKATLTGVKGEVAARLTATGDWAAAKDGVALPEGASVKTGADGEATLTWTDGHAVKVFPLSVVKVSASEKDAKGGSKTELSMEKGRVMAKVAKLQTADSVFTIKTPTAIAGVRGTAFDCAMDPVNNQVAVSVVEGSVAVSVGDIEVLVAEGMTTSVMPGEAPQEPVAIPPVKLNELKSTAGELKTAAEAAAAPAAPEKAAAPDVTQTVTDNVVEQTTIQNAISDTYEALQGCPAGGGCIQGTIEF